MSEHDVAQICLNGHTITRRFFEYPEFRQDYCDECGQKTITACPECKRPIRGAPRSSPFSASDVPPPSYCIYCGSPFPWTAATLEAASELIELAPDLTDEQKQILKDCLPSLLVETPRSQLDSVKAARIWPHLGPEIRSALKDMLRENAIEIAKQLLGL